MLAVVHGPPCPPPRPHRPRSRHLFGSGVHLHVDVLQMRAMEQLDEAADDGTAQELKAFHSKSEANAVEALAGARTRAESGAYLNMANASIQGGSHLTVASVLDAHALRLTLVRATRRPRGLVVARRLQLASWSTASQWRSCCLATMTDGRESRT